MIRAYAALTVMTIFMLGALIYAFTSSGSPFEIRNRKLDAQRIADLTTLTYQIEGYYSKNQKLPTTLIETNIPGYSTKKIVDPETKQEYGYKANGVTDYELCAKFSAASKTKTEEEKLFDEQYMSNTKKRLQDHPKGEYCYSLKIGEKIIATSEYGTVSSDAEMLKRSRDAKRMSDFALLQQSINVTAQEASNSTLIYCNGAASPCFGNSLNGTSASDGTGWVKVNIGSSRFSPVEILPLDPINSGVFHFSYCSDGANWELNTVLESTQQSSRMSSDGGDNPTMYEVGSDLTLMNKTAGCKY